MDFNLFLELDLKEGQELLDEQYPGHRIMHVVEDGIKVVLIMGPNLKLSISKGR